MANQVTLQGGLLRCGCGYGPYVWRFGRGGYGFSLLPLVLRMLSVLKGVVDER